MITCQAEVLLVKSWLGPGQWILPGGGLRTREDSVLGALREVREETGIELDPKQIKFLEKRRARDNGLSAKLIIYSIDLSRRPEFRPRRVELVDVRWFSLQGLAGRSDVSKASKQLIYTWQQLDQTVKLRTD